MRKLGRDCLFNFTSRSINVINAFTIFWLLLYHRKSKSCAKIPLDYVSVPIFYHSQDCCSIFPLIVGFCGFQMSKNFYGSFEKVFKFLFSFVSVHLADFVVWRTFSAKFSVMMLTALPESIVASVLIFPSCTSTFSGSS